MKLILPPDDIRRILTGRKTQLRRLAQRDQLTGRMRHSMTLEPGATFELYTAPWDPEHEPAGAVMVVSVRQQQLRDITLDEAIAEGWRTLAEFADHWMTRHDRRWPVLEEQMCTPCGGTAEVDGERCPAGCDDVGTVMVPADVEPDEILAVFQRRHGQRLVRVVELTLERHRYLHRRSDALYTVDPREALIDAGEAVDAALLAEYAKTNRAVFAGEQRRNLAETLELEDLHALARDQGIDLRDYRRAADRRIHRARQRAEAAEAVALRRAIAAQISRRAA